jgi:predicted secreted protein
MNLNAMKIRITRHRNKQQCRRSHRIATKSSATLLNAAQRSTKVYQCSATQYNGVQRSTTEHNAAQCKAVQSNATQRSATQRSATHRSATHRSATSQCDAGQRNATRRSATQRSATQRSATQRSATQRSATHRSATQVNAGQRRETQGNEAKSTGQHSATQFIASNTCANTSRNAVACVDMSDGERCSAGITCEGLIYREVCSAVRSHSTVLLAGKWVVICARPCLRGQKLKRFVLRCTSIPRAISALDSALLVPRTARPCAITSSDSRSTDSALFHIARPCAITSSDLRSTQRTPCETDSAVTSSARRPPQHAFTYSSWLEHRSLSSAMNQRHAILEPPK